MDKFEEYFAYIGKSAPKTKEEIIEYFKKWIDNPELYNCGFFCVRWAESDTLYNTMSFKEFAEKTTRQT